MAKKIINITEKRLNQIINESIKDTLKSSTEQTLKIEDYFNIGSLTPNDIKSIANDLRVFIQGQGYDSDMSDDGEMLIKEGANATMPVGQLRKELKKLGFKQWQITSKILNNKVRVVVLYADLGKNTNIIVDKMSSFGWTKALISGPMILYGIRIRAMSFDPAVQKTITKEARKYKFLYHWTPYGNVNSILKSGIEPRSENDYLSYPPKAHLMKGDIPKREASSFGWRLYNMNKSLKDGHYALLRVDVSKVPENVEFYGDPRFSYGYFTKETVPPSSLELFGDINYADKYNYNNESINIFGSNDTMTS